MKKLTLLFGYLAAIFAVLFVFFKVYHIHGADWALLIAAILFAFGYAPFLYVMRNKLTEIKTKKCFNLIVLLTMIIGAVTVVLQNYHFVFADVFCMIFFILLILVIIYQVYLAFREPADEASLGKHNLSLVMLIIVAFFIYTDVSSVRKSVMNDFSCIYSTQNQEIGFFTDKTNAFFENFDKNASGNPAAAAYFEKAVLVNAKSDSLIAFIKSLGEEMMLFADKNPVSFDSLQMLCNKADVRAVQEIMYAQKKDSILQLNIKEYVAFMSENTNSRGKEILDIFFPATTEDTASAVIVDTAAVPGNSKDACTVKCVHESCKACCCCTCSLMCQLIMFNADILHVKMLQAETMNYLQTMQARALMRVGEVKEETKE